MSEAATYPFEADLKLQLIDDIDDMGAEYAIGTLDAVLAEASGAIVSEGVTKEMYEGVVISSVTAADMIAVSLGQQPIVFDTDLIYAATPFRDDLRDTEGAADLAEKELAVISDDTNENFADCTGDFATRAELDVILSQLQASLAAAKTRFPGEWEAATGDIVFEISMLPEEDGENDD